MALDIHFEPVEGAPLPCATVMLLRDGGGDGGAAPGLEVLLMRRHGNSRELGGAHVFPGGKLDDQDVPTPNQVSALDRPLPALLAELAEPALAPDMAAGLYLAALRETLEECGLLPGTPLSAALVLDLRARLRAGESLLSALAAHGLQARTDCLRPWSRWITPRMASMTRRRFDARFFIARALPGQAAWHDDHEATEAVWLRPADALRRYWAGAIDLAPPQIICLSQLTRLADVAAVFRRAASRAPHCVEPAPFDDNGVRTICYPGDPTHPLQVADWDAPSRVTFRNGRFEPEGGLAALLGEAA